MTDVQVIRHVNELPDSIEIGTPSKGGVLKVYFQSADIADAEERVRAANAILKLARQLYAGE